MRLEPYRQVLARPGVRPLLLVAMLARVPATAAGITLTLHVVLDMHRGYAAAGLVGAVSTIGIALGAPALGRFVDRRGLRPVVVTTTLVEVVFWAVAPALSYTVLLVVAFVAGLLTLPVFSVARQSLAALVPEENRRAAFSIDSMSVEISYMAGPAAAVLIVTSVSATVAMWAVGAATLLAGIGFYVLNPRTTSEEEPAAAVGHDRRRVLQPRLIMLLAALVGATFVLAGTDVGLVAALREAGQLRWSGVVFIAWGFYSLAGGFIFGAVRWPLPPFAIIGLLGLATIPLGLVGQWQWLCLALLPAGMLCAPSLASSADLVSRLVPASVRGEAMGWYGSALTTGMALGAPVVGAVVDRHGTAWGFAVAGSVGAVAAGAAALALTLAGAGQPRAVAVEEAAGRQTAADGGAVVLEDAAGARAGAVREAAAGARGGAVREAAAGARGGAVREAAAGARGGAVREAAAGARGGAVREAAPADMAGAVAEARAGAEVAAEVAGRRHG
jgi:MFS family permease